MGTYDTKQKTIQSTQTAFDIIETIAKHDRSSISEIAGEVEYSRSTVHYHLKTLRQNRYVVKDEPGFRLGLKLAHLGNLALERHHLSDVIEKVVDDLAAETDAIAHVAVKEGPKLVWLYRSPTTEPNDIPTGVGIETDIHACAYGQAILAFLPTDTIDAIASETGLPEATDTTLTTRAELEERLEMVHDLGFAYSAKEAWEGFSSIAAPVVDESTGDVVASIGITDVDDRIDDPYKHAKARRFSDELPGLVQQSARIAGNKITDS